MNVLIACEYSGTVRDAFENAGFNAWSCDLLETESKQTKKSKKHIVGNVLDLMRLTRFIYNAKKNIGFKTKTESIHLTNYFYSELNRFGSFFTKSVIESKIKDFPEKWDLLIGFPPCTYLSYAYTGAERYSIDRLQHKIEAYQFFLDLWRAPVEHICLENPLGYAHGGLLPYSQLIEPYYFGHDYKKKTCLWLKNLPLLRYTLEDNLFEQKTAGEPNRLYLDTMNKKKRHKRENVLPAFSTGKERSKFHTRIAQAMAEQWGEYLINKK
jgi:site-specific DNA-cytosine methylase